MNMGGWAGDPAQAPWNKHERCECHDCTQSRLRGTLSQLAFVQLTRRTEPMGIYDFWNKWHPKFKENVNYFDGGHWTLSAIAAFAMAYASHVSGVNNGPS